MSFMSSQARTPLANSPTRLSPFNSNKRISPPSQAQGPSAKVVVVISDSETDSEDGFLSSSPTRATTTSANITVGVKKTRIQNNSSVIELSSNDDSDEDSDSNPFDDTHLASKPPRPSTPHPQQQPSPSALSTASSSRSSSPLLHIYRPPQPRPRPVRRGRNLTNLQTSAPLIEMQEGQRTKPGVDLPRVVTLLELKDAMGRMGTIEQEQAIEHHIDDDDQDELVRKVVARLENASERSIEVEKIKEEEEKRSEVKDIECPDGCVAAPADLCTLPGTMTEAHGHTTLREEAMDEKATTEGAGRITEDQSEDIRRINEYVSNYLRSNQSPDQAPGEPIASDDHAMDTTSDGDPEPVHQEAEPGIMGHETESHNDSFIDIETFTDDNETFTDNVETFTGANDHFMTESEDFDEDFDYDADYILGGEFQLPNGIIQPTLLDIDYETKMDESYKASVGQPLLYQKKAGERLRRKNRQTIFGPARNTIQNITQEEMVFITSRVQEWTQWLRPVDWQVIAGEANKEFRPNRPIPVESWQRAFEDMISMYGKKPKRLSDSTQFSRFMRSRELGGRFGGRFGVNRDNMHMTLLKSYQFATTFNYSSASVVDIAVKCDGSSVKLAIANVATQDVYNRPGNLVFCDLDKGFCRHMSGHEYFNEREHIFKSVTVNDIKWSYSKKFLYSGADDGKAMVWDADTGKLLDTIDDYPRSEPETPVGVQRVAVMEDSLYHEDIFASCSSEGGINVYKVNEDGKVCMKNKALAIQGAKRCISSLSFGHGFFWDCLVAGAEGPSKDSINGDHQQGQIVFFDANAVAQPTDLGFRQVGYRTLPRSVSCLAFSASGEFVICGTSGRTNGEEDENGDGIVRIFDVKKAKEVQSAVTQHEDVNLVDFSPCGNYIISCSHTNEITVFDRRFLPTKRSDRPLHVWKHLDPEDGECHVGITSAIWWPTFRQQGLCTSSQAMLMTGGGDGYVRMWDLRAATEDAHVWAMDGRVGPIARVAASPELEHVFVGGDTGAVNVFTIDQGIVSRYEREPMLFLDDCEGDH